MEQLTSYQLAKDIFDNARLKKDAIIDIDENEVPKFRKYLSEMIKRQGHKKLFTTKVLDNNKLMAIRIR